jgi:phosphoglycerate dehydrogenase-like enzyme
MFGDTTVIHLAASRRVRPRILLATPLPDAETERALRADETVSVTDVDGSQDDALRRALQSADAVIFQSRVVLTGEMIAAASSLRVIGTTGSGYDNVDVEEATSHGILVVNGTGVAPHAVAEFVLGAMVAAHRGLLFLHQEVTGGAARWSERMTRYAGRELTGTTLGIIGYGHIGQLVARKARAAFEVDVVVFDPFVALPPNEEVEVVRTIDDLVSRSDTVTMHVPYTRETEGLVGARELSMMRPDAVLIDAARGRIVDEDALIATLRAGHLRGAVLDVFSTEPPSRELAARLADTPRLLVTPHVAGVTTRAMRLLAENVIEQVMIGLRGGRPAHIVNPEVLQSSAAGEEDH